VVNGRNGWVPVSRKQMKPFTIRKAALPSRAGAQVLGDMSVDASVKYATTGGPNRGNIVGSGPPNGNTAA